MKHGSSSGDRAEPCRARSVSLTSGRILGPRSRLRGGRCFRRLCPTLEKKQMMRFTRACWVCENARCAGQAAVWLLIGVLFAAAAARRASAEELTADRLLAPDRLTDIQI